MPLILHPDGGKLLRTATGLAGSTDCCCDLTGCDLFEACFGTPTGAEYPDLEGTAQVSGVGSITDGCDDCDEANVTFDPETPVVLGGVCLCGIAWGGSLVGGDPVPICVGPTNNGTVSAGIEICYDGTTWSVTATLHFDILFFTGPPAVLLDGICTAEFLGEDALAIVNQLCDTGSVAIVITDELWYFDEEPTEPTEVRACDCIGATLTFSLAAA